MSLGFYAFFICLESFHPPDKGFFLFDGVFIINLGTYSEHKYQLSMANFDQLSQK